MSLAGGEIVFQNHIPCCISVFILHGFLSEHMCYRLRERFSELLYDLSRKFLFPMSEY
jgi:hypothetical protein